MLRCLRRGRQYSLGLPARLALSAIRRPRAIRRRYGCYNRLLSRNLSDLRVKRVRRALAPPAFLAAATFLTLSIIQLYKNGNPK